MPTLSNGSKVKFNEDYYFEVEPIEWKVLTSFANPNDSSAKIYEMVSDRILDARRFSKTPTINSE